jgi:hypothetical protein
LITAEKIAEVKKKTKKGYTKEDIAKCFEVHKADMRSWYLFFGVAFFIVGIWAIMKYNSVLLLIAGVILLLLYFKQALQSTPKSSVKLFSGLISFSFTPILSTII